jgi:putative transposase
MEPDSCWNGGCGHLPRLWIIFADSAYVGAWMGWVDYIWSREGVGLWRRCRWLRQFVKHPEGMVGFQVLPKRWLVEHTFAWLGKYRRLNRDYEFRTTSSEAFIFLAMIHLMLRRLSN